MEFINRYADSLLAVAQQKKATAAVYEDVLRWQQICDQHPKLVAFLQSPLVLPERKERLLVKLLPGFHQITQHFFLLVNKRKRTGVLPAMIKAFVARYKRSKSIQSARVVAAAPIAAQEEKKLREFVRKLTGVRTVELTSEVDPSLIGGYVLYIDGKRLDASLRTSLLQLRKHWEKAL